MCTNSLLVEYISVIKTPLGTLSILYFYKLIKNNSNIKIYLCQLNFHVGNINKNLEKIVSARDDINRKGGDLCIFSELSITGYPPEDLVLRKSFIASVENVINKLIPL